MGFIGDAQPSWSAEPWSSIEKSICVSTGVGYTRLSCCAELPRLDSHGAAGED
jgi:hypothetical protein